MSHFLILPVFLGCKIYEFSKYYKSPKIDSVYKWIRATQTYLVQGSNLYTYPTIYLTGWPIWKREQAAISSPVSYSWLCGMADYKKSRFKTDRLTFMPTLDTESPFPTNHVTILACWNSLTSSFLIYRPLLKNKGVRSFELKQQSRGWGHSSVVKHLACGRPWVPSPAPRSISWSKSMYEAHGCISFWRKSSGYMCVCHWKYNK